LQLGTFDTANVVPTVTKPAVTLNITVDVEDTITMPGSAVTGLVLQRLEVGGKTPLHHPLTTMVLPSTATFQR